MNCAFQPKVNLDLVLDKEDAIVAAVHDISNNFHILVGSILHDAIVPKQKRYLLARMTDTKNLKGEAVLTTHCTNNTCILFSCNFKKFKKAPWLDSHAFLSSLRTVMDCAPPKHDDDHGVGPEVAFLQ